MTSKQNGQQPPLINKGKSCVDGSLGEIYQSMENKMALLRPESDGNYTRLTPYVLCRDFIVDVFTYAKAKKKFSIYGMTFDPTLDMPLMDRVCLAMKFPSEKAVENFAKNLDHLYQIESANGFEDTAVRDAGEKEVIITADGRWLGSCLLWSLYTSLLRIFCYDLEGDKPWFEVLVEKHKDKTDANLFKSVAPETRDRVLGDLGSLCVEPWCGFDPATTGTHIIHHNSGFYSVFGTHRELSEHSIRQNVHWKLFKEAGWQLHTK